VILALGGGRGREGVFRRDQLVLQVWVQTQETQYTRNPCMLSSRTKPEGYGQEYLKNV